MRHTFWNETHILKWDTHFEMRHMFGHTHFELWHTVYLWNPDNLWNVILCIMIFMHHKISEICTVYSQGSQILNCVHWQSWTYLSKFCVWHSEWCTHWYSDVCVFHWCLGLWILVFNCCYKILTSSPCPWLIRFFLVLSPPIFFFAVADTRHRQIRHIISWFVLECLEAHSGYFDIRAKTRPEYWRVGSAWRHACVSRCVRYGTIYVYVEQYVNEYVYTYLYISLRQVWNNIFICGTVYDWVFIHIFWKLAVLGVSNVNTYVCAYVCVRVYVCVQDTGIHTYMYTGYIYVQDMYTEYV